MLLSTLLASKAVVAVGSAVIVLGGGTAAVAAAHALPAALDRGTDVAADADETSPTDADESSSTAQSPSTGSPSSETGVPAADPAPAAPSTSPKGPDATGPAAFGLCTAFTHGGLPQQSVAYQALARAAGTGTIEAYCATVKHPGGKPSPSTTESTSSSRHGRPTTAPSAGASHGRSGSHGKPSSAPGRPSSAPTR